MDRSFEEVNQPTPLCTPPDGTHPFKRGHPQHIEPSSAKMADARLIAPFVRYEPMTNMDPELHIGGRIRPDVLFHVLQKYVGPVMRSATAVYNRAWDTELSAKVVLAHLFPVISKLVPGDHLLHRYPGDDFMDLCAHHVGYVVSPGESSEQASEEDQPGLDSFCSSCSILGERGAVDFSFSSRLCDTLQQVWTSLCDCKDRDLVRQERWTDETVWRLMMYANVYGLENAKKGRFNIMHLSAMHLGVMAVAQFHMYGTVHVENGRISHEAYKAYKEQEMYYLHSMQKLSPYFILQTRSRDELQKDLVKACGEVKNKDAAAKFLDGWYVVGNLYVDEKPLLCDSFMGVSPGYPLETMYMIEYWMETLIGRKTWTWTIADVDEIYEHNMSKFTSVDQLYDSHSLTTGRYNEMVMRRKGRPLRRTTRNTTR